MKIERTVVSGVKEFLDGQVYQHRTGMLYLCCYSSTRGQRLVNMDSGRFWADSAAHMSDAANGEATSFTHVPNAKVVV